MFYSTFRLAKQTLEPTLNDLQYIKRCIQYMDIHPHKNICYPSNSYDGSNVIILTWSGNQVKYCQTQNCLEYHEDADHPRIINIIRSVSGIIPTLLGVAIFWKVHIQPDIASDSTAGEIRCIHKDVKKKKAIRIYTEALALHNGVPIVNW